MLSNGVTNIDSITNYRDYIPKAIDCGMTAFAFSEHGCVFEYLHKKTDIENAGLKYIHAEEFYITNSPLELDKRVRDNYHCVLIAKNYNGFLELNALSSKSFNRTDGHFYFAPRITYEELKNTSDNIIISSACLGGIFNCDNKDLKNDFFKFYMNNKNRCFLEVAQHPSKEQKKYNEMLYGLHNKYDLNLVVGTDTHALNEEHADGRLLLQKSKKVFFDNEGEFDMIFRTYDELVHMFAEQNSMPKETYLQALENTNLIADMIEPFDLSKEFKYPKLYNNSIEVLNNKIEKGIKEKGINKFSNYQKYKDEIDYELKAIKHNKAEDFLLLEDMYKGEMRNKGIGYGYSRGSVSGSLVAYLLNITQVDPIEWNLNFDRFMSVDRVSLSDIDTDWYDTDREKVRDFLYNKEGLYCSEIITFNTIALKGAFKDVARAFEMPIEQANEITKDIETNENKYRKEYPEIFKYVDLLQGVVVSIGTHPSAVIVSPQELNTNIGLCSTSNNVHPVSQLNMKEVDSLNYVKLDVLGLDAVGLINQTCDMIGIDRLTPQNMEFNDEKVWESIRENTIGIFQWESDSAQAYLKQLFSKETITKIKEKNPNFSYIDLFSVGNGAIRPAGSSYRDELAKGEFNDNGHKALNDFLAPTLGYLVYQEEVINFLHKFCGYTMGEADIVRRGFAKKTGTEKFIPDIKRGFISTMQREYSVESKEAEKLISQFLVVIEDASSYLFSENHALPYSMTGYACGWLRYYYPLEFLTVACNIYQTDNIKSQALMDYIIEQGITIHSPKFRKSKAEFMMDKKNNAIYKGVSSLKVLNVEVADNLYSKKDETFVDWFDFLTHQKEIQINKSQLDKLIKINYFEEFGDINTILIATEIYHKYGIKKTLKKPIDFDIEGCYNKETAKQYSQLDNLKLCRKILAQTEIPKTTTYDKISYQIALMGYTTLVEPNTPMNYFAVSDCDINKYGTPFFKLYRIYDGGIITVKGDKKWYGQYGCKVGDVLKCVFKSKEKRRKINDKWVATGEYESILSTYCKIEK
jgi:DNA polymerase-3 subunit alpha